jgi:hypothetical protein
MNRKAILAGLALACVAGHGFAQDEARASGDTSLSRASGDIPVQGAWSDPAVGPGPEACPGQCGAQGRAAARARSYVERVLVTPARHERRLVPAVYAWAEREVLAEPARTERHMIAGTYRTVTETEVVTPATTRVERIDPVYDTVPEQVMIRPTHTEWRRTLVGPDGPAPTNARAEATGEVVCLIEVPAEYRTVQHQVLRAPGRTLETPVPAVTRTVTRQIIDQPEQVTETQVPAVYRTERYQRLMSPAHWECVDIPAVYATRIRQRPASPHPLKRRPPTCSAPGAKRA